MTNRRSDAHSPSNIDPSDYAYERAVLTQIPNDICVAAAAAGDPALIDAVRQELERTREWLAEHGWQDGNYAAQQSCDHCGAWFIYGAAFRHVPSGDVIVVGWQCAETTLECPDRAALEDRRLRARVAATRDGIKRSAKARAAALEAHEMYPDLDALLAVDHDITRDIAERFAQWGKVSEAQVNLLRKLADDAKRPPEPEINWQPVTEGTRDVAGTVLHVKCVDGVWGTQIKMLVHLDGDQKVWGTVPRALCGAKDLRGQRVTFRASFERSDDDAAFGFFKRPTRAKIKNDTV